MTPCSRGGRCRDLSLVFGKAHTPRGFGSDAARLATRWVVHYPSPLAPLPYLDRTGPPFAEGEGGTAKLLSRSRWNADARFARYPPLRYGSQQLCCARCARVLPSVGAQSPYGFSQAPRAGSSSAGRLVPSSAGRLGSRRVPRTFWTGPYYINNIQVIQVWNSSKNGFQE